jgi:Mrp family chromosome partitioning ATPase
LARLARGASVVLVTALERKVGRSATARALAHVFAREGRRALLVSFDPDPAERPGLVDAVLDDADPLTLIRRDSRGLDVLGSGLAPGDPDAADLARRPELGDLLDEALEDYQVIVVDGPRLSLGGREAAAQADVVVLLAGRGALGEASRQADALSRALERPVLACAPPRLGGKNAA